MEPRGTHDLLQNYTRYKSYTLSLPAFLSREGYDTSFFSTVSLDFLEQKEFLSTMQFDTIVGNERFTSEQSYVFHAAPDKALYDEVIQHITQKQQTKKQFIVMQTISSHKPYNTPAGKTEEEAFRYADSELLSFYRRLRATHYFDDGILIVV